MFDNQTLFRILILKYSTLKGTWHWNSKQPPTSVVIVIGLRKKNFMVFRFQLVPVPLPELGPAVPSDGPILILTEDSSVVSRMYKSENRLRDLGVRDWNNMAIYGFLLKLVLLKNSPFCSWHKWYKASIDHKPTISVTIKLSVGLNFEFIAQ